ncbi:MAG TPA: DUF1615 family protein, partial [Burkholderiaceae bacterium]|nr:DUF1615 family protein [Burkholderiaceae bacterium]
MSSRHTVRTWFAATLVVALAGCAIERRPDEAPASPAEVRARIVALLPSNLSDRAGWAADYQAAFAALDVVPTLPNLCAALAITEQESSYRADPSVPNLPKIAREEIDRRATRVGVPAFAVRAALQIGSPDGRTYAERLDAVRTEKELSAIYEDFIGMVPMGRRLFAGW